MSLLVVSRPAPISEADVRKELLEEFPFLFSACRRRRPIQLTPFEMQSNYGGLVAARLNLDVRDMRRV